MNNNKRKFGILSLQLPQWYVPRPSPGKLADLYCITCRFCVFLKPSNGMSSMTKHLDTLDSIPYFIVIFGCWNRHNKQ